MVHNGKTYTISGTNRKYDLMVKLRTQAQIKAAGKKWKVYGKRK